MPVAALAATLMLALPAAADAASASSPQLRDPGEISPGDAGLGGTQGAIQLADRSGQVQPLRTPKQVAAVAKGPQLAALGPVATPKPGAKPRVIGPVPRMASAHAARSPLPSRPAARPQIQRPTPGHSPADAGPPLPVTVAAAHPHPPVSGHGPAPPAATRPPHLVGVASYYSRRFDGRLMANGQRFDPHSDTIAHRTLPFGTRVRVVNMTNGRSVMGTIRDRGPYTGGRLLDVSPRIAHELGMIQSGLARVAVWHDGRDAVEIAEAP
jgi:rare lipoprotein A